MGRSSKRRGWRLGRWRDSFLYKNSATQRWPGGVSENTSPLSFWGDHDDHFDSPPLEDGSIRVSHKGIPVEADLRTAVEPLVGINKDLVCRESRIRVFFWPLLQTDAIQEPLASDPEENSLGVRENCCPAPPTFEKNFTSNWQTLHQRSETFSEDLFVRDLDCSWHHLYVLRVFDWVAWSVALVRNSIWPYHIYLDNAILSHYATLLPWRLRKFLINHIKS